MRFPILLMFLFGLSSCGNGLETIEVKSDAGKLQERFMQRKKDAVKEGAFERFFEDGGIAERRSYENDTLVGEHLFYYPSGKVDIEQHYQKGLLHGAYKKYYENGQLQLVFKYENNVLKGEGLGYYDTGVIKEKVHFSNNNENGPFIEYHPNGKLKAEGTYRGGDNEQDTLKLYDLNGVLEKIMFCDGGVCRTIWPPK